ncbi:hypothetical protein N7509_006931 [Penicillium cosmopolitanum]|uniref:Yos1-like protein n=1 Tax=Penicillium cosmopolitanum TaxID=1131564 RepID=A0A9W9VY66_9EURO|nr:uncharacterized protein N7509_006931 [Penicillium cosmopolitanum]KAJ5391441.1 hypothetical protein N7509_006931 [Penicillium cosmopolitanum]
MFFFGFGKLIYVTVLIINAIAVLSEDRFLARIGWGRTQTEPAFGASHDSTSVKARLVKLIDSVRTLMRRAVFSVEGHRVPSTMCRQQGRKLRHPG